MGVRLRSLLCVLAFVGFTGAHANAATLSTSGGVAETLGSQFDFGGWANYDGITPGVSSILVFSGAGNTGGLSVDENAKVTFTYMGTSASYTNLTFVTSPLTQIFSNQTSIAGTSVAVFDPIAAGVLPFKFKSLNQGGEEAINGGSIASNLLLGIIQVNPTRAYAFLEDIAIGGDRDFNDMIIRIDVAPSGGPSQVPLPITLPLFAAGLGAFGLLARRRRRARA
jgi:hypothetical protein